MMMFLNCSRSAMYAGLASLIGYYNFGVNGWIGVATNACFFFLGVLMISTWKRPEHIEEEFDLVKQREEFDLAKQRMDEDLKLDEG